MMAALRPVKKIVVALGKKIVPILGLSSMTSLLYIDLAIFYSKNAKVILYVNTAAFN